MGYEMRTRSVLLTGATGYLGGLIAAALLTGEEVNLVAPVREGYDLQSFLAPIRAEIEAQGGDFKPEYVERVRLVRLPPLGFTDELDSVASECAVDEIIHCAGCLDYFNQQMLEAVNVEFTRQMLEHGRRWGVRRFIYISTAFSSGYTADLIRERLHDEPPRDPTDYTRTKREAERLVAHSGLPYLIIRPSIVIGDSRDGHYSGKQYGVYQLWSAVERLLCRTWHEEFHTVGTRSRVSVVHQDAFQQGFLGSYRLLPDGSILNLVSEPGSAPSLQELWEILVTDFFRPRATYFYGKMSDIPLRSIHPRQRALLALASVNLEIASHRWEFETTNMCWLRERGVDIPTATLESVSTCQRRFVEQSSRIREFWAENGWQLPSRTEFHVMTSDEAFAAEPSAVLMQT